MNSYLFLFSQGRVFLLSLSCPGTQYVDQNELEATEIFPSGISAIVYMLFLLVWCFCGNPNSGNGCNSDYFACSLDSFPHIGLPYSALL